MALRVCSTCGIQLDETEFQWKVKPFRRQSRCPDCMNAANRANYQRNPSAQRERRASYVEANRAQVNAKNLQAYHANPEKSRDKRRRYYESHADEIAQKVAARDRSYERIHTQDEWEAICEALNWCCARCGRQTRLTRDHVLPISQGGNDHILNIQPLCGPCNDGKWTDDTDYRPVWLLEILLEVFS